MVERLGVLGSMADWQSDFVPTTTSTIETSAGAGTACRPRAEAGGMPARAGAEVGGTVPPETLRKAFTTGPNVMLKAASGPALFGVVPDMDSSRGSVLGGTSVAKASGRRGGRARRMVATSTAVPSSARLPTPRAQLMMSSRLRDDDELMRVTGRPVRASSVWREGSFALSESAV